jgi:putative BNR repeat neuraminidase
MNRLIILLYALLVTLSLSAQHKSIVGKGWAGNMINTVVFRHNSVVSDGKTQYTAYYDSTGYLVLAKRMLNSDHWQVQQTPYKGWVRDAHNTISIMLDGAGYLHLSFDHHGNKLNYCKSVQPGSLQLTAKLPMTGEQENNVTYPEFYRLANGDLLFLYRDGESGKGNLVLNRYHTATQKWERVHSNLIDGEGQRNAYWQACVDSKGGFHLSWVWRETPDVASNHDLCYAKSMDGGKTWVRSNGTPYAQMPINAANAEYVFRIPQKSDLINSTSMCTNAEGFARIATYWKASGDSTPQYRLVYFDGKTWQAQQVSNRTSAFSLSGAGTKRIPISRPQVLAQDKKVIIVWRDAERGNKVSLSYNNDITRGTKWTTTDLTTTPVGQWEPSYDTELWLRKHILHLFVQYAGQGDGEKVEAVPAQEVYILEMRNEKR